jgi:hypothetical protein
MSLALIFAATMACAHGAAPSKVKADVKSAPGVSLAKLRTTAVATFTIEGSVRQESAEPVTRNTHEDTMGATDAFVRELVAAGVVVADRQAVDARLAELQRSTGPLVEDGSGPSFGNELGATTLVIGKYRFQCEGLIARGADGDFVKPARVYSQSVQVTGYDLERGVVLFDAELALDEAMSDGRLLPKSLARAAGQRLVAHLSSGATTPGSP